MLLGIDGVQLNICFGRVIHFIEVEFCDFEHFSVFKKSYNLFNGESKLLSLVSNEMKSLISL